MPVNVFINQIPNFTVTNPPLSCPGTPTDITPAAYVKTASYALTYTYWKDANATVPLTNAAQLTVAGVYYIKGTSQLGCSVIKPITLSYYSPPVLNITNPTPVCYPGTVDITPAYITQGSDPNLTLTYWTDANATVPLNNPAQATVTTYYIKGTNQLGCSTVKPVTLSHYPLPVLTITNPPHVCYPGTIDITPAAVTQGSDPNLTLTYWKDANATVALTDPPTAVPAGIYYIKAVNNNGCQIIQPVTAANNPLPVLVVTDPPFVCIPETVDITKAAVTAGSTDVAKYTYWKDAAATTPLPSPTAVADSGIYYIKATTSFGCEVVKPVLVTVHNLPVVILTEPHKIYKPGTTDITLAAITKGSSPDLKFTYWKDANGTIPLPNYKNINDNGTYYIKGTNKYGCYTIKPLDVIVADLPDIKVPTAFTPTQGTNNRLFPFLIAIKKFTIFKIYNKWGNLVYQTNDLSIDKGWDGLFKGTMFLETYTWMAEGYDYTDNLVHRSGNTLLLK
nr:gliding motility-associated C-terminal domain-containing protein [Mucilaginibacter rivuli]